MGSNALADDHGIFLDDVDRDGTDQVHLVLTGNRVRDHSGSGLLAVNKSASSTVRLGDPADPSLGNFFSGNCRYNVELSRATTEDGTARGRAAPSTAPEAAALR